MRNQWTTTDNQKIDPKTEGNRWQLKCHKSMWKKLSV